MPTIARHSSLPAISTSLEPSVTDLERLPRSKSVDRAPKQKSIHSLQQAIDLGLAGTSFCDLANARNPVERAAAATNPALLVTSYDNPEDNLKLIANTLFETNFQHVLEHQTVKHNTSLQAASSGGNISYLENIGQKIVKLVIQKSEIKSLATCDLKHPDTWKVARIEFVTGKLNDFFGKDAVSSFVKKNNWSDESVKEFQDKNTPAGFQAEQLSQLEDSKKIEKIEELRNAVGYLKLYKMLETQMPYFGGAVEFDTPAQSPGPEFYAYFLSTCTKDPGRGFPLDEEHGMLRRWLPKNLQDYSTPEDSLVPYMNQLNLGLGIAESKWQQLPTFLQEQIRDALGDLSGADYTGIQDLAADHGNALAVLRRTLLADHHQPDMRTKNKDLEDYWDVLSEDERKELYGDVAQLPWSDLHLEEGHASYEADFNLLNNLQSSLKLRHPVGLGKIPKGLLNVVGVKGNILQAPEVAAERYVDKLTPMFNKILQENPGFKEAKMPRDILRKLYGKDMPLLTKNAAGDVIATRNSSECLDYPISKSEIINFLKNDFIEKHSAWHRACIDNHLPQIGGMSGHTLGYLNLYCDAYNKLSKEEQKKYPTLEEVRVFMLGVLSGNKKHHSYSEVIWASQGFGGDNGLKCLDRNGYGDVLNSENPEIRAMARKALEMTKKQLGQNEEIPPVKSWRENNFVVSPTNGGNPDQMKAHVLQMLKEYQLHDFHEQNIDLAVSCLPKDSVVQ